MTSTSRHVGVIALFFAGAVAWRTQAPLAHDAGWFLVVAGRVLDGAVLYRDIIEVNPPLGMWAALPIALTSRATGLDIVAAFTASVFVLTAISLVLTHRVLIRAGLPYRTLTTIACLALLFIPGRDFGQREHLLVILAMPWLFLRGVRLGGAAVSLRLSLVIGVLAALGFGMKVHALACPLAIEALFLVATRDPRRSLSPENLALILATVAHIAMVWVAAPLYFTEVIRLGVEAYLPYYHVPVADVAARTLLAALMASIMLAFAGHCEFPIAQLSRVMAVALIGFAGAYAVQAGFQYQFLPATTVIAICMGILLEANRKVVLRYTASGVVALHLASAIAGSFAYNGAFFEQAIAALRPDARTFFIASTNVSHGFPLALKRNLIWTSRFPTQWLAPYVAEHDPNGPISKMALRAVVGDLVLGEPDIVFIDRRSKQDYFSGAPLDYLAFWNTDPRFATLWAQYRMVAEVAGFEIWTRAPSNGR